MSITVLDAGADGAVLADSDGMICEGPGFILFMIQSNAVLTSNRGAFEGIAHD